MLAMTKLIKIMARFAFRAAWAVAATGILLGCGAAHADSTPSSPAQSHPHSALADIDLPADATLVSTTNFSSGLEIKSERWNYSESYDAMVAYLRQHLPSSYSGQAAGRKMEVCPFLGEPGPSVGRSSALWQYSDGILLLSILVQRQPATIDVVLIPERA